jgi:hypothetical protein
MALHQQLFGASRVQIARRDNVDNRRKQLHASPAGEFLHVTALFAAPGKRALL